MILALKKLTTTAAEIELENNSNTITFKSKGHQIKLERGFSVGFRPSIELYIDGISYNREMINDTNQEKWAILWDHMTNQRHEVKNAAFQKKHDNIINFMNSL